MKIKIEHSIASEFRNSSFIYYFMCSTCSTHSGLSIDTLVCLWFEIFRPAETVMSQNNGFFLMREVPAQNRKS